MTAMTMMATTTSQRTTEDRHGQHHCRPLMTGWPEVAGDDISRLVAGHFPSAGVR